MKTYDKKTKQCLASVTLFLTPEEAAELACSAKDLAGKPQKHHHQMSSSDYKTEITVAVYTKDNLVQFDEESRRIITEKK